MEAEGTGIMSQLLWTEVPFDKPDFVIGDDVREPTFIFVCSELRCYTLVLLANACHSEEANASII